MQETGIVKAGGMSGNLREVVMEALLYTVREDGTLVPAMHPIIEKLVRANLNEALGKKGANWKIIAAWAADDGPGGERHKLEKIVTGFYRRAIILPLSSFLGEGYLVYWTRSDGKRMNCLSSMRFYPETGEYLPEEALLASAKDASALCRSYNNRRKIKNRRARILKLTRRDIFQPPSEEAFACDRGETGEDWITAVPIK